MIPERANESEGKKSADEDEHNSRAISLPCLSLPRDEKLSNQDGVDNECQHNSPVEIHETTTQSPRDMPPLSDADVEQGISINTPSVDQTSTDPTDTIEISNGGEDQEEIVTNGTRSTFGNTSIIDEGETNQDSSISNMESQSYYSPPELYSKELQVDYVAPIAAKSNRVVDKFDDEVDCHDEEEDDEIANNDALIAYSEENNRKLQNRIVQLNEAILSIKKYQSVKSGRNMLRDYGLKVELEALYEDLGFLKNKHEGLSETLFELHLQRLDLLQLEEEQQQEEEEEEEEREEKNTSILHNSSVTFHNSIISNVGE